MHAMILAFESPGDFARRQDKAQYKAYMEGWYAYGGSLEKAGVLKSGGALLGPETATVISLKDGRRVV
ncbi:MAG TPA: hypothetical protein PKM48_08675, partial [Parvularculaceae bacterium]|nr:hypothetical protein [Parvularculaceae bacterium]